MKNNIKLQRVIRDMTQEELARKVKVTRQTINAIEKGKFNPSLELAFRLADLFEMKIEELFFYGGDGDE
ncbi:MAG: helix-turn-helix transcriptional regulator [Euryarchaeota archaeon]|nr:helix-turn-helix transcriptional regulator [Euryarchaeota archaeon]